MSAVRTPEVWTVPCMGLDPKTLSGPELVDELRKVTNAVAGAEHVAWTDSGARIEAFYAGLRQQVGVFRTNAQLGPLLSAALARNVRFVTSDDASASELISQVKRFAGSPKGSGIDEARLALAIARSKVEIGSPAGGHRSRVGSTAAVTPDGLFAKPSQR